MLLFSSTLLSFAAITWSRSMPLLNKNKRSAARGEFQGAAEVAGIESVNPWPWDTKCPPHVIKGGCPYVGGPLLHKMSHGGAEDRTTVRAPCTTQTAARARCQLSPADVSSLHFPPMLTASLRDGSRVCVAWSQSYSQTFTLFKAWVSENTWLSVEASLHRGRLVSLAISFKDQSTQKTTYAVIMDVAIEYGSIIYPWNGYIDDGYVTLLNGNLTIKDIGLTVFRSQGNLLLSQQLGNTFQYGEGILGTLGSWRLVNSRLFVRSLEGSAFVPTRLTGSCRLVLARGEDLCSRVVSF